MKRITLTFIFVLNIVALTTIQPLAAEGGLADQQIRSVVEKRVIESRISEVETASGMDEQSRTQLLTLYRKALSNLQAAASNKDAAMSFQELALAAPNEILKIRAEIDKQRTTNYLDTLSAGQASPLKQFEASLQKEKANLSAVDAIRVELERSLEEEANRPSQINQRLAEAKEKQADDAVQLKLQQSPDMNPTIAEARRWVLETRTSALSTEIRMLDQELISHSLRTDLLRAKQDKAAGSVEWITRRIKYLESLVVSIQQHEAMQATTQAQVTRQEAEGMHPLVVGLAEKNAALSEEFASMLSDLAVLTEQTEQANKRARLIEEDYKSARETIDIGGLSQELGHMLLKQRQSLPDVRSFRRITSERKDMAAQIGVQRLYHRIEQRRLRDQDEYIAIFAPEISTDKSDPVHVQLSQLAIERQALLTKAIETDNLYLLKLGELEASQLKLLDAVKNYDSFLDENLLWLRSASQTELETLGALPEQVWQLLSPEGWSDVGRTFVHEAVSSPLKLMIIVALGLLLWARKRLKLKITTINEKLGKPTTDRFVYSLQVLLITVLLAAVWPLLVAFSGWLILGSEVGTDFTNVIGASLLEIALQFFYLHLFYMICMQDGLAAAHFRWPASNLQLLRRELSRLTWIYLPATLVTIIAFNLDPLNAGWIVGRAAFLVVVGSISFAFFRLLQPNQGVLTTYLRNQESNALRNIYWLCFPLLVATPLLLGALSLMGYLYTAGTLLLLLVNTSWLVVGLIVLAALAQRWLLVTRRQVAYEVAMQEREAMKEAKTDPVKAYTGAEGLALDVEDPELDLVALSDTSRKLLNTLIVFIGIVGLWLIWSEVFPAFRILDDVTLWHQSVKQGGEEQILPVTLANIAMVLIYLTATIILVKQLPAVLEIILLHNSDMSAASRYTVTTLASYAIVTIGVILVFKAIRADWSQLQWLIAALGVGIGFGLQEIVANFISGIIILFERPIRVGDVVTVGDTDGVVTRIRIRATTIRNWDGKELLVPNKEFITGRLLNWSLSDQTTRLLISVGIAYGSDVRVAMSLLEEAATENPNVLPDPGPSVIFQSFGDNSLAMVLRCFIETVDLRMKTISDLNEVINDKFNKAGISIAFPQRDIHLDTIKPLRVSIEPGEKTAPDSV